MTDVEIYNPIIIGETMYPQPFNANCTAVNFSLQGGLSLQGLDPSTGTVQTQGTVSISPFQSATSTSTSSSTDTNSITTTTTTSVTTQSAPSLSIGSSFSYHGASTNSTTVTTQVGSNDPTTQTTTNSTTTPTLTINGQINANGALNQSNGLLIQPSGDIAFYANFVPQLGMRTSVNGNNELQIIDERNNNNPFISFNRNGTQSQLFSAKSTLDDGSGNMTVNGPKLSVTGASSNYAQLGLSNSGGAYLGNYASTPGDNYLYFQCTNSSAANVTPLTLSSTNNVSTSHTTLDDGSGNMTVAGTISSNGSNVITNSQFYLKNLNDVSENTSSLADGQVLTYNNASGKWVNQTPSTTTTSSTAATYYLTNGNGCITTDGTFSNAVSVKAVNNNRLWLTINNNSVGTGVGDGATIAFEENGKQYWEVFNHVNVGGSYTAASDYLGFWNDGAQNRVFYLYGNGKVATSHNTLDDDSGNMIVNGTGSAPLSVLNSGMATNATTTMWLGQSVSNYNTGWIHFNYLGSGNTGNTVAMGLYGGYGMSVDGNDNVTVNGRLNVGGSNQIGPVGTNNLNFMSNGTGNWELAVLNGGGVNVRENLTVNGALFTGGVYYFKGSGSWSVTTLPYNNKIRLGGQVSNAFDNGEYTIYLPGSGSVTSFVPYIFVPANPIPGFGCFIYTDAACLISSGQNTIWGVPGNWSQAQQTLQADNSQQQATTYYVNTWIQPATRSCYYWTDGGTWFCQPGATS